MDRARAMGLLLACGLLAAPVAAQGGMTKAEFAALVKSIETAVRKGDVSAAQAGFKKAVGLEAIGERDIKRLADAIGKGVRHKDPMLALAAMTALGELKSPGSSRLLGRYMQPPRALPDDKAKAELYLTAVRVAGRIHDKPAQTRLVSLLRHHSQEVAVTAAQALVHFSALEPKERTDLIKRLVKVLAGFEKTLAKAGGSEDARDRTDAVRVQLITTLGQISGYRAAVTSTDWNRWLRDERKRQLKTG